MKQLLLYIEIAWEALQARALRSFLASLGVMFGVASVMAMLAIGKGARNEIMAQMQLVGHNSIIVVPATTTDIQKNTLHKISRGLCTQDAKNIQAILPSCAYVSPEISFKSLVTSQQKWLQTDLYGIENSYFLMMDLKCKKGTYFNTQNKDFADAVCVIGNSLESKLFGGVSALGRYIRCDKEWLKVVGVLEGQISVSSNLENAGIHNTNMSVYIPIQSVLRRFDYKKLVKNDKQPLHQLSRIVIQVKEGNSIVKSAEVIESILLRTHAGSLDFEIIIPEQVLRERQKTQEMLNYVLGAIAGISLLIGGIGIMNIMLTSVLERTQEIGIRRVVGATHHDIRNQFLVEATIISLFGGVAGILIGFVLSWIIKVSMSVSIVVDWTYILGSFCIVVTMGIVFGWYPAKKATLKTPHELLRYE